MNWGCLLVAVVVLCGQAVAPGVYGQTDPGRKITTDEIKPLIKSATTPEEYLKVAGYFRQEQAKLEESAKAHNELSQVYQFNKVPVPAVADMQRHCEDLVHAERNAASAARAMAEYYEEMADLTRKSR